jgi:hypothetical protein
MHGQKRQASGKMAIRYASRRSICRTCPLRGRCLAGKGERREIERWVDEDVIERHRARMRLAGEDMMRRRKALAEHPFGTLKCRAGYRHFLVRGFAKVRGEWSLMALCYNFSRVLRIIGLDRWKALLAQRAAKPLGRLVVALLGAYRRISGDTPALWRASRTPVRVPRPLLPRSYFITYSRGDFLAQPQSAFRHGRVRQPTSSVILPQRGRP